LRRSSSDLKSFLMESPACQVAPLALITSRRKARSRSSRVSRTKYCSLPSAICCQESMSARCISSTVTPQPRTAVRARRSAEPPSANDALLGVLVFNGFEMKLRRPLRTTKVSRDVMARPAWPACSGAESSSAFWTPSMRKGR